MTNLTNSTRDNGSSAAAATAAVRAPLADMFGFDPLDLFGNFHSPLAFDATAAPGGLDITRNENGYVVEIPVAGYKPDQINITYKDDVLSVSGKSERRTFTRSLAIPHEIDPDHIRARVEHGLLTLALNRRPQAEPKRIQISVTS